MRYFFTPSLLAAVAVAGHASNEAAMSVNKESPPRNDAGGSGTAGQSTTPSRRARSWRVSVTCKAGFATFRWLPLKVPDLIEPGGSEAADRRCAAAG
jgi:hypothetical protein